MFDVFKTIKFGRFKQKTDKFGRDVILPIEWYILDTKDNTSLLLSKYCIFSEKYHIKNEDVVWETSTIRYILNNKDDIKRSFILNAFTEDEEKKIITVELNNSGNPYFDIDGGKNTFDKIFFLSIDEFNKYLKNNVISVAAPIKDASKCDAFISEDNKTICGDNATFWSLRSPGHTKKTIALVNTKGELFPYGGPVDVHDGPIRIAMWIRLN